MMSKEHDSISNYLERICSFARLERQTVSKFRSMYPEDAELCDQIVAELTNRINMISDWPVLLAPLPGEAAKIEFWSNLQPELVKNMANVNRLMDELPAASPRKPVGVTATKPSHKKTSSASPPRTSSSRQEQHRPKQYSGANLGRNAELGLGALGVLGAGLLMIVVFAILALFIGGALLNGNPGAATLILLVVIIAVAIKRSS